MHLNIEFHSASENLTLSLITVSTIIKLELKNDSRCHRVNRLCSISYCLGGFYGFRRLMGSTCRIQCEVRVL